MERFERLISEYVDDELKNDELSEFEELVRTEQRVGSALVSDYRLHRLLAAECGPMSKTELADGILAELLERRDALADGIMQDVKRMAGSRRPARRVFRLAIAACLAIVVGGAAYLHHKARLFRASVVAHVGHAGPGASVDRDGRRITVASGMPLALGDRIETGERQELSFSYDGEETRVRVRGNTTLVLERTAGCKELSLRLGEITADVAAQPEGRGMRVVTPHAEMTVLGTVFSVSAAGDTTGLTVSEGTVRIAPSGGGRSEDTGAGRVAFAKAGLNRVIVPGRLVRSMSITGLPPGTVIGGIAFEAGHVWVHGSTERDRAPVLARLDAATGAVTRRIELQEPFMPGSCITWKKGLLWGFGRDGTSLRGVDIRTGATVRTIPLPVAETSSGRIFDIQGEFGWLRGRLRDEVIKIDLRNGTVLERVMCPFAVDRIAASANAVYAGKDGWAACKIGPRGGRIAYRFMCEAEIVTGDMACDENAQLWAVTLTGTVAYVFEVE